MQSCLQYKKKERRLARTHNSPIVLITGNKSISINEEDHFMNAKSKPPSATPTTNQNVNEGEPSEDSTDSRT